MKLDKKATLAKSTKHRLLFSGFVFASLFGTLGIIDGSFNSSAGGLDFQWDPDPNFVRLKEYQTSNERMERSTYYFYIRSKERKTGILKLSINVPDYFKAKITADKLNLCHVKIGGFDSRTKCKEDIPAIFEVNKSQTAIDIYPDTPIPVDKKNYAIVMQIKNPRKRGMFQFNGYAQSPGAMPISSYMGTWSFDVK